MNFTINLNTNGNHGHQIKDWIGSYTIGLLLGLKYHHTYSKYLNFFLPKGYFENAASDLRKDNCINIQGPLWDGIRNYNEFQTQFKDVEINESHTYIFETALRVHPFQTIDWFQKNYINQNIFEIVCNDATNAFYFNKEKKQTDCNILNVCIHVNLHKNNGSSSNAPRFQFPVEYYLNIVKQLEVTNEKELSFHIYAEKTNSHIVRKAFSDKKFKLHIGPNRNFCKRTQNFNKIHSIFKDFVDADILVCSNSSFSVIASYFRALDANKITVYHPHDHLGNLGDYKNFIATDITGSFKI
jgi:hypothetical protein